LLDAGSLVDRLHPVADNVGGRPANDSEIGVLPRLHVELLRALNGFTLQAGSFRLFGVDRGDALDLERWNETETWRFAWDDRVEPYVFFASTAWGDQYAYRRTPAGALEPTVYFLEATLLRSEPLAESFEGFAETELLRVAAKPYDSLTVGALDRYGPIAPSDLWAFAPSLALGGEESFENVVRLRARDAMTMAGDIASALRASVPGPWPTQVLPWVDDQGRQRLGLTFDSEQPSRSVQLAKAPVLSHAERRRLEREQRHRQ
jgi:hypothetical protein